MPETRVSLIGIATYGPVGEIEDGLLDFQLVKLRNGENFP